MAKDRNGQVKPHNLGGSRFKDGSLREDIPLGSLHTQFNCNFSIVSQTNPHIHLFFFAPRGSVGKLCGVTCLDSWLTLRPTCGAQKGQRCADQSMTMSG